MASAAVTEATLYDVDMPHHHAHHQPDQRHADAPDVVDDHLQAEASATGQEEDEDRQSYPLGQSHTPLTSIPTLGQALIDGNNLDRKYVHSFLQVLADHSQFSDKYQHYEEDEYERKRKRKLRESERKMFFYAGQSANGGVPGDKSKRKASSVDKGSCSGGASASNKKRRRKERERERERVLDKDARRQLSGSAPMMSMAGQRSDASPFHSPPTVAGTPSAERTASMPNMPNMPQWSAAQNDRNASFYSASVPSAMPSHAQDMAGLHHHHHHPHQAASHMLRHRASMPQLPTQQHHYPQRHGGYLHLSAGPGQHPHYSPSSSFDYMPQPSPLSSSLSSSASSAGYYTSPTPSPASHIVPIRANDYAPSPPTYHQPQHLHVAMQQPQQPYASYYQHQPHQRFQRQPPLLAASMPAEFMLDAYGGHLTAEEQPNDATLDDESWTSSSSSISASSSGEFSSGSESFSCFGPLDPAALGGATAGDDGDLACADMASAAAAAVESFMLTNQHHHKEESSPEGAQQAEDWFNSFFSDPVGSPLLGQAGEVATDSAQCYPSLDPSHIDSLFADVESFYGRLVN